jgi:hypothetical protein
MTRVKCGYERRYFSFGSLLEKCGNTGMRCSTTLNSSPQEKCEMQISMMLSRNYTRRRIPTQPKIVGTLRSFLWFSAYESHYDRDVNGLRTQEYWQTSRSTVL